MNIGVILARFQSPYLHEGYLNIISSVSEKHSKTVIVLGVSPVLGSRINPLDFSVREKMIKNQYPDMVVLPLDDQPSDTVWSRNLDDLLNTKFPNSEITLYKTDERFTNTYLGIHKIITLPGTQPQENPQFNETMMSTEEFRSGIIYAYSRTYLKVYPTVDVAVFRNNKTELLLGKKEVENKWRLPGGFTDPADDSYESAARRELQEECGEIRTNEMTYEGSFRIIDWRYGNEPDKIITSLFSTDFIDGTINASDDIAELKWFSLTSLPDMMKKNETSEEHRPLLKALLKKYT